MKIRHTLVISLIICLLSPTPSHAQKKAKLARALEEYAAGHYATAADQLKKAYTAEKKKDKQADIFFKIAECYRMTSSPKNAELYYRKAVGKGYSDPIVYLHLGDAKKMMQQYAEAKEDYIKYKEKAPGDRRGDDGIKSCDLALKWLEKGNGYQVENMKFFNSRQADFAPAYGSSDYTSVYFTSSREASNGKNVNAVTDQEFTDIFVSKLDRKNVWSQPIPVEGEVNSEYDDGTCSFSSDFKTMYFTRCKNDKKKACGCQILSSQVSNDVWGTPKVIELAEDTIVVAHPAISPDDLTLYFVSDMDGGQGGKDIWRVTRNSPDDEWGKPENLGADINTPGDEMFPYVHPDGMFYFSSNGQIGMGGLDIFKATNEEGRWKVENMGYPINSYADDFGITFQAEEEKGFFSTNRTVAGDKTGNDEIYAFNLPPLAFTLTGTVVNEKNQRPLGGGKVKVISSDGITDEKTVGDDGTFKINMKANTDYVFLASHKGFLNGKERETTKGVDRSRDFKITIPLTSIDNPIEVDNIFYDFAKWDLRPESMVALDQLVEVLNDNPNITIELGSHTDSRGDDKSNQELSQKRAQSVVDYLIQKGIAADRLTAKGYGESQPLTVTAKQAEQYPFLKVGTKLTEEFINSLKNQNDQETAHQLNRRTDFRVLRTDYEAK